MSSKPLLKNVKLKNCCKKSLKEINDILTASKTLQKIMIPAAFATCLIGPSKGSAITSFYSISTTDWSLLANAVSAVPAIARHNIKNICAYEALVIHTTGDLNKFWHGMYESFS